MTSLSWLPSWHGRGRRATADRQTTRNARIFSRNLHNIPTPPRLAATRARKSAIKLTLTTFLYRQRLENSIRRPAMQGDAERGLQFVSASRTHRGDVRQRGRPHDVASDTAAACRI